MESVFGLQAVRAIRYKGQQADINQLAKWGKWALNQEVANIHDRFKVLRNRKKERMVFTKQTAGALAMRMDRAEEEQYDLAGLMTQFPNLFFLDLKRVWRIDFNTYASCLRKDPYE